MGQFNTQPSSIVTSFQRSVLNCKKLLEAGEYDSAIALLKELREQQPRDVAVLRMLGHGLMMIDVREEAIRHLSFALKLQPRNTDLYVDLAAAYRRTDQLRKAHQTIDQALELRPNYPRAVMTKARLLQSHGSSQQAYELVKAAVEQEHSPELLGIFGQLCREFKRQGEAIDLIRESLKTPNLERSVRQDLLFVLGHLLDSVGEYDEAFDCFAKGNAMSAEYPKPSLEKWHERWTKENYESIPESDVDGSRCVFIVGMPRSGTTLTEQIIASHPNADGIGEADTIDRYTRHREVEAMTKDFMNEAGQGYLSMLDRVSPDKNARRVCDKMPENYYFCGFITRALPGAKIIHCKRNPIDTCLSIYFQRFGPRIGYATDLENCANQYLGYLGVMDKLQNDLQIEMLDTQYEQTTSDPEPSIRRLLDHVGLRFDEACMNFHKSKKSVHTASVSQIRQPLYTSSSQRWKNYEKHIGPLIEKLGHLIED
ncbi:MAG: sulfotransferase [Phycisphaerales bacterium JB052]